MTVLRTLLAFSGRMNRREYAAVFFGTVLTFLLALIPIIALSKAIGDSDADGYLYFVDRKKDSIRRRGEYTTASKPPNGCSAAGRPMG